MKKSDLKDGCRVTTREGNVYWYFEGSGIFCRPEGYLDISSYNEELIHEYDKDYDFVKVDYSEFNHMTNRENNYVNLCSRSEETVMTIKEIEQKLGINNLKIVK